MALFGTKPKPLMYHMVRLMLTPYRLFSRCIAFPNHTMPCDCSILELFFDMNMEDGEVALKHYKRFIKQSESVVVLMKGYTVTMQVCNENHGANHL